MARPLPPAGQPLVLLAGGTVTVNTVYFGSWPRGVYRVGFFRPGDPRKLWGTKAWWRLTEYVEYEEREVPQFDGPHPDDPYWKNL